MSFQFQGGRPAGARVTEAKLYVEHHEEARFSPDALMLQVGGGTLTSPTTLATLKPPVITTELGETIVEWDVSRWIATGAAANDLKLVVRNGATNGKKVRLDSVFLIVRYASS